MNHKENEPPNPRYVLHQTIDYQQRYHSPDSDTASSASSIFSSDDKSSQGSPLSSPVKSERSWNGGRSRSCTNGSIEPRTSIQIQQLVNVEPCPEPRLNSRRKQCAAQSSVCQTQSRCPPQLIRQCDRTQNFVENLVGEYKFGVVDVCSYYQDTATQMIEAIWPMTVTSCDKDHLGGTNLIGLRTFIQEVLKRSKTSYYTLQVALYYLVLIKPCVPYVDSLAQHTDFTHAQRAMRCGRRMFLAALILASKYLQDRNYSARAWSKISGLKIAEINSNEIAFLTAVNWKLHIPEPHFQRWANIVFKYSTSQSTASALYGRDSNTLSWRQIIPRLTPELDEVDIERFSKLSLKNVVRSAQPPPPQSLLEFNCSPHDGDKTPTPATMRLPRPATSARVSPPDSPRIPALPTPVMTPRFSGFCPPAARTWCQGQAMRETMQQIQQQSFRSASLDEWPTRGFLAPRKPLNRVMSSCSIMSSPESMVSDFTQNSCSSRTSRSSSICSVTSSVGALPGFKHLNPSANHRSALAGLNGSNYMPTCTGSFRSEPCILPAANGLVENAEMDATLALLNMARPDSVTSYAPLLQAEPGQKRARPLSIVDSNALHELRANLTDSYYTNVGENRPPLGSRLVTSFVLPKPELSDLVNMSTSSASQAGARKKQRGCSRSSDLWTSAHPLAACIQ